MRRTLWSLVLALMLGWSGAASAGDYQKGMDAAQAGDHATALREFRDLADEGHAGAQSLLGSMYNEGLGVTQDYAEAVKWFRLAAEQGDAGAQHDLGMKYLKGQGVSQDFEEAAKWVRLAAEQGLAESQLALGTLYKQGLGVPQDHREAAKWLRRAAKQGNILAQMEVEAPLAYHIIQQLRCLQPPEPVFTFLALENLGKINRSEMLGYDSISCFRIHGGIEVEGLKFVSVCGYSEDSLVRDLFPDFLWRGPGTSPDQFISFGTKANFKISATWYLEHLGRRFLNQAIETENTRLGDPTDISCRSWMR